MDNRIELTLDEIECLNHLSNAWNAFMCLGPSLMDQNDFMKSLHDCQRIIASRLASRSNPEVWRY